MITSRLGVGRACWSLLVGTLVIVIDIRIGQLDLVADIVGAALVLVGLARIRASIEGAETMIWVLIGLAVVSALGAAIETVQVDNQVASWLGTAALIGTVLLADLLAKAFAAGEPELSRNWRLTHNLVLWLGLAPLLVVQAVLLVAEALSSGGFRIETPLVIPIILVLAIPLIYLLITLSRTTRLPVAAAGNVP